MNKKFSNLFTEMRFTIYGNYAFGKIRNYETNVVVRMMDTVAPVTFHISCFTTPEQRTNIDQALRKASIKFLNFAFTEYGITLGLNDITAGKLIARLPELLNQFIDILSNNGALDSKYCPMCGTELSVENTKTESINGFVITMDRDCVAKIITDISNENQAYENAPNNYLNGFFGALIGGAVGAILTFVLALIGYVSSLPAFLASFLGGVLYRKFKGKQNVMMIVIVSVTTLLCMIGIVYWIFTISALGYAYEDNLMFASARDAFAYYMDQDIEFAGGFRSTMISTAIFSLIGIGYQVYAMSKTIRRRTTANS